MATARVAGAGAPEPSRGLCRGGAQTRALCATRPGRDRRERRPYKRGGLPTLALSLALRRPPEDTVTHCSPRRQSVSRLLKGIDHRPLLAGMNEADLEFYYDRKMEERRPYYEKANFHLKHQDIEVISDLLRAFIS